MEHDRKTKGNFASEFVKEDLTTIRMAHCEVCGKLIKIHTVRARSIGGVVCPKCIGAFNYLKLVQNRHA